MLQGLTYDGGHGLPVVEAKALAHNFDRVFPASPRALGNVKCNLETKQFVTFIWLWVRVDVLLNGLMVVTGDRVISALQFHLRPEVVLPTLETEEKRRGLSH